MSADIWNIDVVLTQLGGLPLKMYLVFLINFTWDSDGAMSSFTEGREALCGKFCTSACSTQLLITSSNSECCIQAVKKMKCNIIRNSHTVQCIQMGSCCRYEHHRCSQGVKFTEKAVSVSVQGLCVFHIEQTQSHLPDLKNCQSSGNQLYDLKRNEICELNDLCRCLSLSFEIIRPWWSVQTLRVYT